MNMSRVSKRILVAHLSLLTVNRDGVFVRVVFTERKIQNIANELSWILLYFGIGLLATLIVHFPASILVAVAAIIVTEYSRKGLKKGLKSMIKRRINLAFPGSRMEDTLVQYYCLGCGLKHKSRICPNCGSNLKKIG